MIYTLDIMLTPHPKTIFFDWNKTLSHSRFWEHLEDPTHPRHSDGKAIVQFLFNEQRSLLKPWMRGELSTHEILSKINAGTGILYDFLLQELKVSCEDMSLVHEGIVDQIQELRNRGIRCVIASDNMDTFRTYTLPVLKLDDVFDDFLLSNELRVLKHDIDREKKRIPFFENYLRELDLKYSDVVLLDDTLDDGFYAYMGLQIVQVTKPDDVYTFLESVRNTFPQRVSRIRSPYSRLLAPTARRQSGVSSSERVGDVY